MPKFKHEQGGVFLGTFFGQDVYLIKDSLLVRYSDGPGDYGSGDLQHVVPYWSDSSARIGLPNGESKSLQEYYLDSDSPGDKAWVIGLVMAGFRSVKSTLPRNLANKDWSCTISMERALNQVLRILETLVKPDLTSAELYVVNSSIDDVKMMVKAVR